VLNLADYQAVGGMAVALSQHLNSIYDGLGGAEATPDRRQALQLATKRLFQSLVDIGEDGRATRRPLRFAQLSAETGMVPELLTEVSRSSVLQDVRSSFRRSLGRLTSRLSSMSVTRR
jgi:hypothetical protein